MVNSFLREMFIQIIIIFVFGQAYEYGVLETEIIYLYMNRLSLR